MAVSIVTPFHSQSPHHRRRRRFPRRLGTALLKVTLSATCCRPEIPSAEESQNAITLLSQAFSSVCSLSRRVSSSRALRLRQTWLSCPSRLREALFLCASRLHALPSPASRLQALPSPASRLSSSWCSLLALVWAPLGALVPARGPASEISRRARIGGEPGSPRASACSGSARCLHLDARVRLPCSDSGLRCFCSCKDLRHARSTPRLTFSSPRGLINIPLTRTCVRLSRRLRSARSWHSPCDNVCFRCCVCPTARSGARPAGA
jgi:hypothetical protein